MRILDVFTTITPVITVIEPIERKAQDSMERSWKNRGDIDEVIIYRWQPSIPVASGRAISGSRSVSALIPEKD